MTNLITITPTESEYSVIREQAAALVKTGFLPQAIKTPEQAIAIMLTGRELGIPAMTALNGINVIQGKPTISPQLMLGLIERSGQLEDIRFDTEEDGVTVTMKRRGRTAHSEVFGPEQARAMQLLWKDNYKKQAFTMFKWRAVSACARVVFPDVLLGLYTHEEMAPDAQFTEDGDFVDAPEISEAALPSKTEADLAPVKSKKEAIREEAKRADLIAYCGRGFRELNDLNIGEKWTHSCINDFIVNEFGVEGGIHNLATEQIERLASQLDGWYRLHTEGHDNPEAA